MQREHTGGDGDAVERCQRVNEVAALVGVLQTHGQVVVGDDGARLVGQNLEEVRGNRRAEQLDQDLAHPRQAFGLAHAGTGAGVASQWRRASSASSAPPGTGSMGPAIVTLRTMPCLSIRNIPCSCAVMAW